MGVTHSNSAIAGANNGTTVPAVNVTGSSSNTLLLVCSGWFDSTSTRDFTPRVGGSSSGFVSIGSRYTVSGGTFQMRMHYKLNPGTGTLSVDGTFNNPVDNQFIAAAIYTGVHQLVPVSALVTASGSSINPSVTVPTGMIDGILAAFFQSFQSSMTIQNGTQRQQLYRAPVAKTAALADRAVASGAVSYTQTTHVWGAIGAALFPAPVAPVLQTDRAYGEIFTGNTFTRATFSAPAAGQTVIVVANAGGRSITSVQIGASGTPTTLTQVAAIGIDLYVFVGTATGLEGDGTITVTASGNVGDFAGYGALIVEGLAADQSGADIETLSSSGTSWSVPAVTPPTATNLVLVVASRGNRDFTEDSDFAYTPGGGAPFQFGYLAQSAATPQGYTLSSDSSTSASIILVAFAGASGGVSGDGNATTSALQAAVACSIGRSASGIVLVNPLELASLLAARRSAAGVTTLSSPGLSGSFSTEKDAAGNLELDPVESNTSVASTRESAGTLLTDTLVLTGATHTTRSAAGDVAAPAVSLTASGVATRSAAGDAATATLTLSGAAGTSREAEGALQAPELASAGAGAVDRSTSGALESAVVSLAALAERGRVVFGSLTIPESTLTSATDVERTVSGALESSALTATGDVAWFLSVLGQTTTSELVLDSDVAREVLASGELLVPSPTMTALCAVVRDASGGLFLVTPVLHAFTSGSERTVMSALSSPVPELSADQVIERHADGSCTFSGLVLEGASTRFVHVHGLLVLEPVTGQGVVALERLAAGTLVSPLATLQALVSLGALRPLLLTSATAVSVTPVRGIVSLEGEKTTVAI